MYLQRTRLVVLSSRRTSVIVVVQQLVQREGQVPICRLSEPRSAFPSARSASSISRKTSTLVPWQRSWRGENRSRHRLHRRKSYGAVIIADWSGNRFHWALCRTHPIRPAFRQALPEFQHHCRPRAAAPGSLEPICPFPRFPGFEDLYDTILVNDREKLLAHLARLSLALDFVAVDDAAAIRNMGQVPAPRATVPDLIVPWWIRTISNEQIRPSEPGPDPSSGLNRTPVPSGASRQLGDSGTRPSQ